MAQAVICRIPVPVLEHYSALPFFIAKFSPATKLGTIPLKLDQVKSRITSTERSCQIVGDNGNDRAILTGDGLTIRR
jgi:hypothetical protein